MSDDIDDFNGAPVPDEEQAPTERPSLVINIHSWATPIVGVLALVIGLLGGYFGRPLIQTDTVEQAEVVSGETNPGGPTPSIMDFLVEETRHFKGDPNAPVTIIELSDFQ